MLNFQGVSAYPYPLSPKFSRRLGLGIESGREIQ